MPIQPITPLQSNARNLSALDSLLSRGGATFDNAIQNAVQVGRDIANRQSQQERNFLTEQRRGINLDQRRAENVQQDFEDKRTFDESTRRFDLGFEQSGKQFDLRREDLATGREIQGEQFEQTQKGIQDRFNTTDKRLRDKAALEGGVTSSTADTGAALEVASRGQLSGAEERSLILAAPTVGEYLKDSAVVENAETAAEKKDIIAALTNHYYAVKREASGGSAPPKAVEVDEATGEDVLPPGQADAAAAPGTADQPTATTPVAADAGVFKLPEAAPVGGAALDPAELDAVAQAGEITRETLVGVPNPRDQAALLLPGGDAKQHREFAAALEKLTASETAGVPQNFPVFGGPGGPTNEDLERSRKESRHSTAIDIIHDAARNIVGDAVKEAGGVFNPKKLTAKQKQAVDATEEKIKLAWRANQVRVRDAASSKKAGGAAAADARLNDFLR